MDAYRVARRRALQRVHEKLGGGHKDKTMDDGFEGARKTHEWSAEALGRVDSKLQATVRAAQTFAREQGELAAALEAFYGAGVAHEHEGGRGGEGSFRGGQGVPGIDAADPLEGLEGLRCFVEGAGELAREGAAQLAEECAECLGIVASHRAQYRSVAGAVERRKQSRVDLDAYKRKVEGLRAAKPGPFQSAQELEAKISRNEEKLIAAEDAYATANLEAIQAFSRLEDGKVESTAPVFYRMCAALSAFAEVAGQKAAKSSPLLVQGVALASGGGGRTELSPLASTAEMRAALFARSGGGGGGSPADAASSAMAQPDLSGLHLGSPVTKNARGERPGAEEVAAPIPWSDVPPLTAREFKRYAEVFAQQPEASGGSIGGEAAKALFSRSGLPRETLRQVWVLADADADRRLNEHEFVAALWLMDLSLRHPAGKLPEVVLGDQVVRSVREAAAAAGEAHDPEDTVPHRARHEPSGLAAVPRTPADTLRMSDRQQKPKKPTGPHQEPELPPRSWSTAFD